MTVLIISVIVQIEQRKRERIKDMKPTAFIQDSESKFRKFQQTTSRNYPMMLTIHFKHLEGEMTYDDA